MIGDMRISGVDENGTTSFWEDSFAGLERLDCLTYLLAATVSAGLVWTRRRLLNQLRADGTQKDQARARRVIQI